MTLSAAKGDGWQLLLCPYSMFGAGTPFYEAHRQHVKVLDAFYEAAPKDEDHEFTTPGHEEAYEKLGRGDDYMRLYRHEDGGMPRLSSQYVSTQTWWWQCHVCGFVLPVTNAETLQRR